MNTHECSSGTCKSGPYIVIAILSVLVIVLGLKVLNDRDRDRPQIETATNPTGDPTKPSTPTDESFSAHEHLGPSVFAEYDPVAEAKKALDSGNLAEAEKQLEFVRLGDEKDQAWAESVTQEISLSKSEEHAKSYLATLDDKLLRFMVALTTSHKAVHEFMDSLPESDELRKSFEKGEQEGEHADLDMPGREFFNYVATWNAFDANLRKHLPDVVKERKLDQPASKTAATETPAEPEKKPADLPAKEAEPKPEPKPEPATEPKKEKEPETPKSDNP